MDKFIQIPSKATFNPAICSFCKLPERKIVSGAPIQIEDNIYTPLSICELCVATAIDEFRKMNGIKFIRDAMPISEEEMDNIYKKANIFYKGPQDPHRSIVPISYWEFSSVKKYITALENEVRKLRIQNVNNSVDYIAEI